MFFTAWVFSLSLDDIWSLFLWISLILREIPRIRLDDLHLTRYLLIDDRFRELTVDILISRLLIFHDPFYFILVLAAFDSLYGLGFLPFCEILPLMIVFILRTDFSWKVFFFPWFFWCSELRLWLVCIRNLVFFFPDFYDSIACDF